MASLKSGPAAFLRPCSGQSQTSTRQWSVCIGEHRLCPWWRPTNSKGRVRLYTRDGAYRAADRLNALLPRHSAHLVVLIQAASTGKDAHRQALGAALDAIANGSTP